MSSNINNQIKFEGEKPVLLIIFNRTKLTKKLLKSLELLKPNRIYLAANGSRNDNLSDFGLFKHIRELLSTEINKDSKLEKKYLIVINYY